MQDAFCITYDKWNGKGSFLNVMSTEQKKGHVISRNSAVSAV